jgi:hypothetical protein
VPADVLMRISFELNRMRREAIQLNNIRPSSNECRDVGSSEFEAISALAGPRLRAGDEQSGSCSGPEVGLWEI